MMRIDTVRATTNTIQSPSTTGSAKEGQSSFSDLLRDAITSVNDLQVQADHAAVGLATGTIDDLHSVTIATTKAELALQLTLQIRNRVIEAYQEISRMQV